MKLAGIVGCSLGCASFLFATYVSVTGGPNMTPRNRTADYERSARIAASAKQTESPAGGCCSHKKEGGTADAKSETGCSHHAQPEKSECGNKEGGGKCSHN